MRTAIWRPARSAHFWRVEDSNAPDPAWDLSQLEELQAQDQNDLLAPPPTGENDSEPSSEVSKDPNVIGFAPAYMLGNVYVCQLPYRCVTSHISPNLLLIECIATYPAHASSCRY